MVFISSCSPEPNTTSKINQHIPAIKWITGNYTFNSNYGHYYENWQKTDSLTYTGLGYFMDSTNVDTLFKQRMKLHQTGEAVFMEFNVKNQNDNKNVEFKLTKQENKVFTFENAFRDYPSIVTYKMLTDTTVNVLMHGFKNGEERSEDFVITRLSYK